MNYRHSFHAGNIADVFKHYVLLEVLTALAHKPKPFCVIDSHAGAGLYRLRRPGEFEAGVGALWDERTQWPLLQRYFAAVEKYNDAGTLQYYPGSPLFIQAALRGEDRAVLVELHPQEHEQLKIAAGRDARVAVHRNDAWSALKGFIPPAEKRGLVLIDPPYEQRNEFGNIATALAKALAHWRNGVYLVWYPIKGYRPIESFHRALRALDAAAVAIEFLTLPLDMENRLNGSGMVMINAPWQLPETLVRNLAPLAKRLAGTEGRPSVRLLTL